MVEHNKGEFVLKIERLLINFKTLEEFKRFKEYGMQELSMLEDLQDNIIENDSTSPFYGIYFGDKLVARMSLYQVNGGANPYFDQRQDFWNFGSLRFFRAIKITDTEKRLLILQNPSECRSGQIHA